MLQGLPGIEELLFADFMEQWLDVIKPEVKPTTFGGYQMNVQKAIAPYFRKKGHAALRTDRRRHQRLLCRLLEAR